MSTSEIYTLSLHDALPVTRGGPRGGPRGVTRGVPRGGQFIVCDLAAQPFALRLDGRPRARVGDLRNAERTFSENARGLVENRLDVADPPKRPLRCGGLVFALDYPA